MPYRELVNRLAGVRVAIIGDVILDHYVEGRVSRVSEEAPVPILRVERERQVPGGAANVAANIAALGGAVTLHGVIGNDLSGRSLSRLLKKSKRLSAQLSVNKTCPTIVKTRYIGGPQQMVRVDREDCTPVPEALAEELLRGFAIACDSADIVVLSDYGKGLLSDRVLKAVFAITSERNKVTIVDPKRLDFTAYRGATYLTPNRKELSASTGLPCDSDEEAADAARLAMKRSDASILLTRSEKGMSLFQRRAKPIHIKAEARQVFDVSGAGDTVVAALAAGLASGAPVEQCMRLANVAAGLVIAKSGTAVIDKDELLRALSRDASRAAETIMPELAELVAMRRNWKQKGLTVGFTNGCFDLLHPGHISLLSQAARQCDRLIVALNSDKSVRRLKGPTRPVQDEQARLEVVAAIKGVDAVTLFSDDTPLALIKALKPDVLIKGADYTVDTVVGADEVISEGGRVYLAKLVQGQSTTALIAKSKPKKATGD